MQVNTHATHVARVERMAALSRELDRTQGQIATGKRMTAPSDDPVGSGIATRLRRVSDTGLASLRAIDTAASRLSATDQTLGSAGLVMQRAREIALLGANATLNSADRATLAAETAALSEQLLGLANAIGDDGTPLFGGASGGGPAFGRDALGAVVWLGTGTPPVLALGSALVIAGADAGAFTSAGADAFKLLDDLRAALAAPASTRAAALVAVQAGLESAGSRLADAQAGIGTAAARLDGEALRLRSDGLRLAGDLSRLEDVDMATAIARLQRLATILEATQASFVRLTSLSLWDRL